MTNKLEISREQLLAAANRLSDLGQSHLSEPLFALINAAHAVANHSEEPLGMVEPVAYRYREGHATWENEKPWEPTTLEHAALLLERKSLAANGAFKGDSQAYYLALTVDPLYTSPPAPVAVVLDEKAEFMRAFPDADMRSDGSFIHGEDQNKWRGWQARACLDKVKEMNK